MILLDIFIGLLTGLYSGLIAAKYLRYVTLRNQALQLVKQIEQLHGLDEKHAALARRRELKHLKHVAQELQHIGYSTAAQKIHDVAAVLQQAHHQNHTAEDLEVKLDSWLDVMQRCHPALLPTLQAWRT